MFRDAVKAKVKAVMSGFHADLRAVMLKESVGAGYEVRVESGEPLFLISGNAFEVSHGDTAASSGFVLPQGGSMGVSVVKKLLPKKMIFCIITNEGDFTL